MRAGQTALEVALRKFGSQSSEQDTDTTGRVRLGLRGECSHPKKFERTGQFVLVQIEILQLFKTANLRRQRPCNNWVGVSEQQF